MQRAFSAVDPKRVAVVLAIVAAWLLAAGTPLTAAPQEARAEPPLFTKKDDIKKLLRERKETSPSETKNNKDDESNKIEPKRPEIRRDGPGGGVGGGPNVSVPSLAMGNVCWIVFAGLMLAVVVTGLVLFWVNRPKRSRSPAQTGRTTTAAVEETLEQLHQLPVATLLQRADELARQGKHLEALRAAYLAVLSLLHRKQFLRLEPTRTNGEYIREVRLAPHAPPALHEPFNELTMWVEAKWYGEHACEAREYGAAREVVEAIQRIVGET